MTNGRKRENEQKEKRIDDLIESIKENSGRRDKVILAMGGGGLITLVAEHDATADIYWYLAVGCLSFMLFLNVAGFFLAEAAERRKLKVLTGKVLIGMKKGGGAAWLIQARRLIIRQ